ncbi:pyridoxamine 5'-phosphate oxidase family protein [Chitinophaga oryzae]|uniref:Pyridoxamine 5'-phosphate oxidase family protein n=1 Tax=Chitinophaga oryzae TaxID=2725414 RepID=A0AAE7D5C0_9BACT|nr:pyridoxamine 5'-phosphate oxidase family protein [Chitinophaga oryzae]QJB30463.1 pyridoxamine 5'-phosphate oxidase family protein [Chitinophaga oryzae]
MLGKLNDEEIDQVLANNVTGRIGCQENGKVYIVPVSYAFNDTYVVAHSQVGMKIEIMRKHPQVCFQVDEITGLTNWRSVICWGDYEEIVNSRERYYAMKFLVGRLSHLKVSETAGVERMHEEMAKQHILPNTAGPVVYRIRIHEKTGRYEKE